MKSLNYAEYTFVFDFNKAGINFDDACEEVFKILSTPEKVEKIIGKNESYDKIWNQVAFEEEDFVSYVRDVIEYVCDDYYENNSESQYVIGFKFHEQIDEATLRSIYQEVFLPLLKSTDENIESIGVFNEYLEYRVIEKNNFKI